MAGSWVEPALLVGLILLNVPLYWVLYHTLFQDLEELVEAIWFLFTPDLISAFRGEFWEDQWAECKLGILIVVSVVILFFEYCAISRWLSGNS